MLISFSATVIVHFTVTLEYKLLYQIETYCSQETLNSLENIIKTVIEEGLSKYITRYNGLCGTAKTFCSGVVAIVESCGSRKKRQVTNYVTVNVSITDVP